VPKLVGLLKARFTSCFLRWFFGLNRFLIPWRTGIGKTTPEKHTHKGIVVIGFALLFALLS
jgi:hypothetical protein